MPLFSLLDDKGGSVALFQAVLNPTLTITSNYAVWIEDVDSIRTSEGSR